MNNHFIFGPIHHSKILYSDKFPSDNNKAEYISSHMSYFESTGVIRFYLLRVRYFSGEGNGTPLHYSCLENPMDGGAW